MSKHTPGPWHVSPPRSIRSRRLFIQDAGRNDIAETTTFYARHVAEANARLIAKAPEMRDVIAAAIEVLDAQGIVYGDSENEPLDVLRTARALLAEIDGGAK